MSENENGGRPWERGADLARYCYACGDLNPIGLHLEFEMDGDWAVAKFVAQRDHQGYPGYVHGGIVSSLLDEAMGWATYGRGVWALTGKLETRFRDIVPTNELLIVRGCITRDRGRTLDVIAELRDTDGKLLAESKGLMFRATGEQAKLIEAAARAMAGKKD
ncbi:MAG TPA: PaaI family thioesterase [Dehalococcoidia bacterium]|nr:PaaI family thioesterase [Dehalococcoidia bacterium]